MHFEQLIKGRKRRNQVANKSLPLQSNGILLARGV